MFDRIKTIFSHSILTRYSVEGVLHRHPFFVLRSGRDKKTMRPVLLKDYTRDGIDVEAKFDRLFRDRPLAALLPDLKNPYIVHTLEAEHSDARRIEVLEPIVVPTLHERLDKHQLNPEELRTTVMDVGRGLLYLHSQGLIHRGLAPDGIAVADGGDAKLIDLSLVMDASRAALNGTTIGPLGYVAPEVIARRGADQRSDVYALGAVCYEALSGMHLFPITHGYEGLVRMMNTKPATLSERGASVPAELEAVVMKAVEKNPRDRFQTIGEMLSAFDAAPLPERLGERTRVPAYAA